MSRDLFHALRDEAVQVLRDLRDRPCSPEAIAAWSRDWRIESSSDPWFDWTRAFWRELRESWDLKPECGRSLIDAGVPHRSTEHILSPQSQEYAWCESVLRGRNGAGDAPALPNPRKESLDTWLQRAKRLYLEREALMIGRRARGHRDHTEKFYRWFVQVQVLGLQPLEVSKADGLNSGSAVSRAVRRVAGDLGITPRDLPRGPSK